MTQSPSPATSPGPQDVREAADIELVEDFFRLCSPRRKSDASFRARLKKIEPELKRILLAGLAAQRNDPHCFDALRVATEIGNALADNLEEPALAQAPDAQPEDRYSDGYSDGQRDADRDAKHERSRNWMNALLMLVHYADMPQHLRPADYDARLKRCWDDARRLSLSKPGDLSDAQPVGALEFRMKRGAAVVYPWLPMQPNYSREQMEATGLYEFGTTPPRPDAVREALEKAVNKAIGMLVGETGDETGLVGVEGVEPEDVIETYEALSAALALAKASPAGKSEPDGWLLIGGPSPEYTTKKDIAEAYERKGYEVRAFFYKNHTPSPSANEIERLRQERAEARANYWKVEKLWQESHARAEAAEARIAELERPGLERAAERWINGEPGDDIFAEITGIPKFAELRSHKDHPERGRAIERLRSLSSEARPAPSGLIEAADVLDREASETYQGPFFRTAAEFLRKRATKENKQ